MLNQNPTPSLASKTCPGCLGSGRVRRYDVIAGTSEVLDCDVCGATGVVQGHVTCPQVRVSGRIHVLNPGDPGYAEARAKKDQEEKSEAN